MSLLGRDIERFVKKVWYCIKTGRVSSKDIVTSSVTIGLPRSGTNFFQHILRRAARIGACSVYTGNRCSNIKSHALSYEFLLNEFGIFNIIAEPGFSLIILIRDPRDVLISFYEFFLARGQGFVSMSRFLDIDWFLAYSRGTAKTDLRNSYLFPLSVKDAISEFAKNWMDQELIEKRRASVVRYEELADVESAFAYLVSLGFLTGQADYAAYRDLLVELSRTRVSQYSSEKIRMRATPFSYKDPDTYSKYKNLILAAEKYMPDVFDRMGYS